MKILCAEYNTAREMAIIPIGDDALLRNNGDFYIPEYTREVSCVPQLVVKICKLGKCVSERFACRYYDEMGIGVRFYADTLEKELEEKGLPLIMASSFDSCAAISDMSIVDGRDFEYEMLVNDASVFIGKISDLPVSVDRIVAMAGTFHTLKIGDYMFCGNPFRYRNVKRDDQIKVFVNGKKIMDFGVK